MTSRPSKDIAAMPLPLFARFPGTAALPLARIATLPTPLEPLAAPWLGREPLGDVLVKRDDLTSAAYGGNKVRKLDFLLGDAVAQGATSVLTFGAYGSNHALATAVHARALGLVPHAVLSPQEPGPFAPATLLAHVALGTNLYVASGWDGAEVAERVIAAIADVDGAPPYVIPMGGTNALGATGFVNAALEVAEQVAASGATLPDVVYVAAGTLATAVGLAIGFAAAGAPTRVEAIRVTPADMASERVARRVTAETVALLRSLDSGFPAPTFDDLAFELRHDHFEPGYGVVTPATQEAVALAAEAGIKLETTYTGRAFSAMIADARLGALEGRRVLFWDTYSSAPVPAPGPVQALPQVLRDYIAECEREFGASVG